jgi:hypothetical protein
MRSWIYLLLSFITIPLYLFIAIAAHHYFHLDVKGGWYGVPLILLESGLMVYCLFLTAYFWGQVDEF